ncbi:MAG: low molecular weight phosphotyrosine protein phosphatase [Crocinitomicaceae bacterium]|nr:low molecular weight phosphotyrosine protein phosphatase [Crocinitomicaceae bacterium]MDG1734606.1 low molecular weight phosphotyrosine protein phosphatase [Crocinitomicaceae bacterium]MDG2505207.1 low molecular weight phosphotyrosine protein phosphatase [Crocinitomicaceae bacterium]
MRILMVCLGNICRSPMADGLMRKKVQDNQLDIYVDSAGTANYHVGGAPDTRMTATAKSKGIDISGLKARQFIVSDFDAFDLIYVMDQSNYNNVVRLARNETDIQKVQLILELRTSPHEIEVPDPYYGGQDGFEHVYQLLDESTDIILKRLTNE